MPPEESFETTVKKICEKDSRYTPDAYFFLREALDFTSKTLQKPQNGPKRHVSGGELLEGIRAYALQEFAPMALTVLAEWGIKSTRDFGEIVFNLVESGKLGSTEQDKKEDFDNGYDFYEAFAKPFIPAASRKPAPAAERQKRARGRPRTGKKE